MERFVASKGRLPSWAAKIRAKSPKRLTLIRGGVGPNWVMLRPELDPQIESEATPLLSVRQNFYEG